MKKTRSVNAIARGTVIDHIPPKQAVNIIRLLKLTDGENKMTIGLNLSGSRAPKKDIIKIEDRIISQEEAQNIAFLAPGATINIIEDFDIKDKIIVSLPEKVVGLLDCPNTGCITHYECINSVFTLKQQKNTTSLSCKYCEKVFSRDEIKEYGA